MDDLSKPRDDEPDSRICCCHSDSRLYSRLWPIIFIFSILTDFPMPLPKGKKPGQHRDWGILPVLMVLGLAAFVFYGYTSRIVIVLLWDLNHKTQAIIYLVIFSIFFLFFLITYFRIVSQKPGHPNSTQMKPFSILGESKWCDVCQLWKPDRAHHCRVCDACVLRMDHHCPWVNGCVGISNYRFYIQFLCYVTLLGTWIFTTVLAAFVQFDSLTNFDGLALAVLVIGGVITFIVGAFTMSHLWLILVNRTTIENSQFQKWKKKKRSGSSPLTPVFIDNGNNVFDQGYRDNWIEVMGSNIFLWFLPLMSKQGTDVVRYGHSRQTLKECRDEEDSRRLKPIREN